MRFSFVVERDCCRFLFPFAISYPMALMPLIMAKLVPAKTKNKPSLPNADKPVSFGALKATLKKAGYTLDSADLTVGGTLVKMTGAGRTAQASKLCRNEAA